MMKKTMKYLAVMAAFMAFAILPACNKDSQISSVEPTLLQSVRPAGTVATVSAYVEYLGKYDMTVEWSPSEDLASAQSLAMVGDSSVYSATLTGLSKLTTYYYRVTLSNAFMSRSTAVESFTTSNNDVPTVTTAAVTNVGSYSATGGGNVTGDGGNTVTERGVCWSTSHNPTVSGSHASIGSGTGNFTVQMTNLTPNTKYYMRAYATNSLGTGYGEEVSFTTQEHHAPTGAINGKFTINPNGDKVYFSKGNLQYIGSVSLPYWKFADNQWDVLGTTTGQNSTSQTVDRDLFGWGTSGYHDASDPYNVNYQPWSTSASLVNEIYNECGYGPSTNMPSPNLAGGSAQYDWGVHNAISNGCGQTGLWRTLSQGEWDYVFNNPQRGVPLGSEAHARYAKAQVAGVHGVIVFPDSYTHPGVVAQPVGINEIGDAGWNGNDYSSTDFGLMQDNGAVFLPAAGYRSGASVGAVGSHCYYWSVSGSDEGNAYHVYFNGTNLYTNGRNRYFGESVRLVVSAEN